MSEKTCAVCGVAFSHKKRKTCGYECLVKLMSRLMDASPGKARAIRAAARAPAAPRRIYPAGYRYEDDPNIPAADGWAARTRPAW